MGFGGSVEDSIKEYTFSVFYHQYQCLDREVSSGHSVAEWWGGVLFVIGPFRYHCFMLSSTMLYLDQLYRLLAFVDI